MVRNAVLAAVFFVSLFVPSLSLTGRQAVHSRRTREAVFAFGCSLYSVLAFASVHRLVHSGGASPYVDVAGVPLVIVGVLVSAGVRGSVRPAW